MCFTHDRGTVSKWTKYCLKWDIQNFSSTGVLQKCIFFNILSWPFFRHFRILLTQNFFYLWLSVKCISHYEAFLLVASSNPASAALEAAQAYKSALEAILLRPKACEIFSSFQAATLRPAFSEEVVSRQPLQPPDTQLWNPRRIQLVCDTLPDLIAHWAH